MKDWDNNSARGRRINLQFDLEQEILALWNTKEDLEVFLEAYMDGPKPMTEDEAHNLVYGIACMHDLKCDKAFRTFENLLKTYKEEREGVDTDSYNEALEQAAKVVETEGLDCVVLPPTESIRNRLARKIRAMKVNRDDS